MMKLLFVVLLAIGWGEIAYAQADLPSTCYSLKWDNLGQEWDSLYRDQYTYTFAGGEAKPSERIHAQYYASVWNLQERHNYSYAFTGELLQELVDTWDGSQWEDASRYSWIYDAMREQTGYLWEGYNGTSFDSLLYRRNVITYNAQNLLTEKVGQDRDFNQGTWINDFRESRSYNNANEVDRIEQENWQGAWIKGTLKRDYVWEDFAEDKPAGYFRDAWNTQAAAYLPVGKYGFEYTDAFGSRITTLNGYDSDSMSYDSTQKAFTLFDQQGNKVLEEVYSYSHSMNTFVYIRGDRWTLTYNPSGAIIDELHEFRFSELGPWGPDTRRTCEDFVVGSKPAVETDLIVQWAPHPVGQSGSLLVESDRPGELQVEVLDVQGKSLRKFALAQGPGQQGHDLNLDLSPGLYLYRVQLNDRTSAGRLLVQ